MAETLTSYEFSRKRASKYPWQQWTDGQVWVATEGTDFTVTPAMFRASLYRVARQYDVVVRTSIRDDGSVVFQFAPKESDSE